jgi:hypothetical protein
VRNFHGTFRSLVTEVPLAEDAARQAEGDEVQQIMADALAGGRA